MPMGFVGICEAFCGRALCRTCSVKSPEGFERKSFEKMGSDIGITERPPGKRALKAGLSKRFEMDRYVSTLHGIADISAIRSQCDTNIVS